MCHTSPHPPGLSTAGPVSLSQLMQQHQQHQQGRGASNQPLLPTTTSYNILLLLLDLPLPPRPHCLTWLRGTEIQEVVSLRIQTESPI